MVVITLTLRQIGMQIVIIIGQGRDFQIMLPEELRNPTGLSRCHSRGIDLPRLIVAVRGHRPGRQFEGLKLILLRPLQQIRQGDVRQTGD